MNADLTFLGRDTLSAARRAGVDDDILRWASAAMDSCGIPEGFPFITLDGTIFDPAWRWQRAAPQALTAGTWMRYMRDVRRLVAYLSERGISFENVTSADLRAYAERRRSETAVATWAAEEAAVMSLFRFCTEGDGSGWRMFDRNPWPMWRTANGNRSALRRPADTVPSVPRFLDDDELRFFLTVGMRGLSPSTGEPLPEDWPVSAPLVPERDLVFVSFVLSTGARMTEARHVLVNERRARSRRCSSLAWWTWRGSGPRWPRRPACHRNRSPTSSTTRCSAG